MYRVIRGATVKIRKTMEEVKAMEKSGWIFDGECDEEGNKAKVVPMSKRSKENDV
jgi:hypothetical protein